MDSSCFQFISIGWIVGAIFFVAAQMRPGMPGVMTVAMIGALSAYVDARTHRLPNAYTLAMAIGVVLGVIAAVTAVFLVRRIRKRRHRKEREMEELSAQYRDEE